MTKKAFINKNNLMGNEIIKLMDEKLNYVVFPEDDLITTYLYQVCDINEETAKKLIDLNLLDREEILFRIFEIWDNLVDLSDLGLSDTIEFDYGV